MPGFRSASRILKWDSARRPTSLAQRSRVVTWVSSCTVYVHTAFTAPKVGTGPSLHNRAWGSSGLRFKARCHVGLISVEMK